VIIQDTTENRQSSRFHLDVPESDILEAFTGADFLVSPAEFPATSEALIRRHVEAGAMLVQRKSLRDMVESCVDDRGIKASLARMHDIGAQWWQCCVLASGVFMPDVRSGLCKVGTPTLHDNGRITFHWQRTTITYKAFATAKRRFNLRGGWIDVVSCDDEIPGWLQNMERDLKLLKAQPVCELYPELEKFPPDECDPFQEVKEIVDARTVLAAFHGIGKMKATSLWNALWEQNKIDRPLDRGWTEEEQKPSLGQLLVWATVEDPQRYYLSDVPLWGPKTRQAIRDQIPLCEGQDFQIVQVRIPEEKEKRSNGTT
jgi:hypothetical protein